MLKKFRPNTPGQRHLTLLKHECLTRVSKSGGEARAVVAPEKSLLSPKKSTGGRNNRGKITCRHRGGGHKRHYRQVDFRRVKEKIPALVHSIEYDPGRSAYVALLFYADGEKQYIIAPQGLKVGARVVTDDEGPFDVGCSMRLKYMPVGSVVHNIEIYPGRGAQLVRSAGLSAQLMARSGGYATIKMPSKEIRLINEQCKATFGSVSNPEHSLRSEGKAGRMRWKGVRPTVRGNAMNPVDHPHGGAEGKNKGNTPQSPWGVYAKGFRTRKKSKSTKMIVKDRRKK